ncbi:MAG: adenine phosphoribosyltransferase [Firmicutes bacterium]|nr:adenine phosphoribosyltransferase [Alicyclobacillaceae bacterium]MCL6497709.1 adenine phosphoribosyltransferase [Bacillota bacterium]
MDIGDVSSRKWPQRPEEPGAAHCFPQGGSALACDWRRHVRQVPDFPRPGVLFYDLMPVLAHPDARDALVCDLVKAVGPWQPQVVAAPEARAFLLAAAVADRLSCGLLALRKPGKLPPPRVAQSYALEYGQETLEAPAWIALRGQRVVAIDDVLATGGTAQAVFSLIGRLGGHVVGGAFAIEIAALRGRAQLPDVAVKALWSVGGPEGL